MSESEAKKRYDRENMATIAIKAKKEIINNIKDTALDNGVTCQKLLIACYRYCMDAHIDISELKKYI